jgi:prepilin-type N-terminal cleavage/methylation domain-containing protein
MNRGSAFNGKNIKAPVKPKGFTLVEVIVVSVIVAVLALLAVQLYFAYINESRKNAADNVAASAASFLCSAANLEQPIPSSEIVNPLVHPARWSITMSGSTSYFACPAGTTVDIDQANKTVKATVKDVESESYAYDK